MHFTIRGSDIGSHAIRGGGSSGVPAMKRDLQTIHEHEGEYRNLLWTIIFVIAVVGLVLSDPFIMQVR